MKVKSVVFLVVIVLLFPILVINSLATSQNLDESISSPSILPTGTPYFLPIVIHKAFAFPGELTASCSVEGGKFSINIFSSEPVPLAEPGMALHWAEFEFTPIGTAGPGDIETINGPFPFATMYSGESEASTPEWTVRCSIPGDCTIIFGLTNVQGSDLIDPWLDLPDPMVIAPCTF